jgi:nucleoside-diphosphate-sugar epimerase
MRVYVTGATGLIGSHTAARLREEGHEVVALCRRGSDTSFLEGLGCATVEGDVRDPAEQLAPAMSRCTHVLHGAALVYAGGSWSKVREVNVEGTRHVLAAAAAAGVGHAVHVSSVAVYGTVEGPVDEESPTDRVIPERDLYARSKREAEAVARGIEAEAGLPVTILRPAAVYGERDRLMAVRIARMVRRPVTFLLGPGDNTLPALYAGNVAAAAVLALEAGRRGATYVVGEDHPLTQRGLLEGLAVGLGRSPVLVPIPAPVVRVGSEVLQKLGVSAPGAEHLPLARVARLALSQNPYGSARIRRELGWDPPHRHEDALERTGRWLLEHAAD